MKIKYTIEGLDCPNCAAKLAKLMEKEVGVTSCKINFLTEEMTVEADAAPDTARLNAIARGFEKGITVSPK